MSRVVVVTGGTKGIGKAVAERFSTEDVVAPSHDELDVTNEEQVAAFFEGLRQVDVLVNNAGIGIGAAVAEQQTKYVDMQIAVNIRAIVLFYRECAEMLRAAGAEHKSALVVNMSSIAGKSGQGWLSVYSATKAGMVGYSQASQKELGGDGIQVTAFCPAFVDTPMTEWARENVDPKEMIQPEDLGEAVRFLLRTSPNCLVPEIAFLRPGDTMDTPELG